MAGDRSGVDEQHLAGQRADGVTADAADVAPVDTGRDGAVGDGTASAMCIRDRDSDVDQAAERGPVDAERGDAGAAARETAAVARRASGRHNTDRGDRDGRSDFRSGESRPRTPVLPEEAQFSALDPDVRAELRSLPKVLAEVVGRHLVAAGMLIDSEPEAALEHARYARSKAARVGIVREAAGLTAYHAGEWAEALSELRAARRMTSGPGHLAVLADCERALGRPERAIELAREANLDALPKAEAIELRIVAAGARRDMGQVDAAVVALQGPDLDPKQREPWSARLFYAYADNLAAAGRREEAIRWFLNAAEADEDGDTDAAERAFDLAEDGAGLPGAGESPAGDSAAEPRASERDAEAAADADAGTVSADAEPVDTEPVDTEPVDAGHADTEHGDPAGAENAGQHGDRADSGRADATPVGQGADSADTAGGSAAPDAARPGPAGGDSVANGSTSPDSAGNGSDAEGKAGQR